MVSQYSPDRLADRFEIQDVIYRWARGVDRRDWEMVRTVFHADGTDSHGIFNGGVEALIAWLKNRHEAISQSMHFIGNILIEFTGPDSALVESYSIGYQKYAAGGDLGTRVAILGKDLGARDGEIDTVVGGRYVDEFERRNGLWKVFNRTTVFENIDARLVEGGPRLNPAWTVQRRDSSDAIGEKRLKWGLNELKAKG